MWFVHIERILVGQITYKFIVPTARPDNFDESSVQIIVKSPGATVSVKLNEDMLCQGKAELERVGI